MRGMLGDRRLRGCLPLTSCEKVAAMLLRRDVPLLSEWEREPTIRSIPLSTHTHTHLLPHISSLFSPLLSLLSLCASASMGSFVLSLPLSQRVLINPGESIRPQQAGLKKGVDRGGLEEGVVVARERRRRIDSDFSML